MGWEKKSKCVNFDEEEKEMFVCVILLFLALKQRYRLLPVFGNMIVNNGWASLLFEISRY